MTENNELINITTEIMEMCKAGKQASDILALTPAEQKNEALLKMADFIRSQEASILAANKKDTISAQNNSYSNAFIDRLILNPSRIEAMAESLESIAALPEPVGRTLATLRPDNKLHIERISVPLGMIGVIYESRPNVTADAAALCLKAGNAVILRCGSECVHSAHAILNCLTQGLEATNLPLSSIQIMPTQDRRAVGVILKMKEYIDVIIPRGGKKLIERVNEESQIPLFKHLEGICHTYIHSNADLNMAVEIVTNAKMRRPGICGATETLLIDHEIVNTHLPSILQALFNASCEIRGDDIVQSFDSKILKASDEDWNAEYLDAIISIKVVENIDHAIKHIKQYSSNHTDAIITSNEKAAETFLNHIDSAIVMHNCSTQYADGGEFGMGAEIGIATGKLHARGPVGIEQLTTFKYKVRGTGQTRP